jgi:hypothetical protein
VVAREDLGQVNQRQGLHKTEPESAAQPGSDISHGFPGDVDTAEDPARLGQQRAPGIA